MNPLFGSAIRGVVENTLLEVSDRAVSHVMENHADKLPFDDLFQGNLRKIIPLESKKLVGIKNKLTSFGLDVDIPNKKAFVTKQTQRGPKKVEMKLGKAIGSLQRASSREMRDMINDGEKYKELLQIIDSSLEEVMRASPDDDVSMDVTDIVVSFLDKNMPNFMSISDTRKLVNHAKNYEMLARTNHDFNTAGDTFQESEYSIVISRAPLDVLRMSDFDAMGSCHSEPGSGYGDGSYWQCAVTEAIRGGLISYVVHNDDLKNLEDINQSEIFTDHARSVRGIEPKSRLRIRNFIDEDGEDMLAVPEYRVYGSKISGFKESVVKWAYDSQIDKYKDEDGNINYPDLDEYELKGGSYEDNTAGRLFRQLFKTDKYDVTDGVENADYEDDDFESSSGLESHIEELEGILSQYVDEANRESRNGSSFYFDSAEEYDVESYHFSVSVSFGLELPKEVGDALERMNYSEQGEYFDDHASEFSDYNFNNPYLNFDIEDHDLSTSVSDHDHDVSSITSNIDYYLNFDFDDEEIIKKITNKLISEDLIAGSQSSYAEELEGKFSNFSLHYEDDPDEEEFNTIQVEATISSLRDIKDEASLQKIRKTIRNPRFVKVFFERVVDYFKPNLKQLLLPNVDYGPIVNLSVPRGGTLNLAGYNVEIAVVFDYNEDSADEFVEFITAMNGNIGLLEKILRISLEEFLL